MSATLAEILKLNASLIFALFELNISHTPIAANLDVIPKNLQVPENQQLVLKASAKGSQIYVCKAKSSDYPTQFEWTLKAPDAVLLNEKGQYFGKHYAGPTWEASDGSKVAATVKSKANPPQGDTVPWLLLEAKSHQGTGIFSQVSWIQRVNTIGGKAPDQGCNQSTQDREIRVNYTADYLFYRASSAKTQLADQIMALKLPAVEVQP